MKSSDEKLIYPELSYEINGILFEVHNDLGRFCNELQYGDAIEKLLKEKNVKYSREQILEKSFDSEKAGRNKVDFLIEDKIILEIKAKRFIVKDDYYQTKRYLISSKTKLGLLVNFRDKYLRPRRVLNLNTTINPIRNL